jgi:hypothetical protein
MKRMLYTLSFATTSYTNGRLYTREITKLSLRECLKRFYQIDNEGIMLTPKVTVYDLTDETIEVFCGQHAWDLIAAALVQDHYSAILGRKPHDDFWAGKNSEYNELSPVNEGSAE